jgi:hypothetical protein
LTPRFHSFLHAFRAYCESCLRAIRAYYHSSMRALRPRYDTGAREFRARYDAVLRALRPHFDTLMRTVRPRYTAAVRAVRPHYEATARVARPRYDAAVRALRPRYDASMRAIRASSARLPGRLSSRSPWLTLGVAAALVAAVAGLTVGLTAGGGAPAVSHPAAIGQPAGHTTGTASGPSRWTWRSAAAANPQSRDHLAAKDQVQSQGAAQKPAAAQHPAAAQKPAASQQPAAPAHAAAPAAPARPAAPAHTAAPPAPPAKPWTFYDSVEPGAIPAGQQVATYATGPYAASPSELTGRGKIMWIDVTGTDYNATALDTEPSDATPTEAADWAYHRLLEHPHGLAHIYTMISEWPAVKQACAWLPASMQDRIRWWIADPTGVPHIVPGAQATQWYWGSTYDISTAAPDF